MLPGRSGIDLLPDIRRAQPDLKILVVTMHVDRILAEPALAAGAMGFVPKDSGMDEVETGLREVLAGRRCLSPRVPKHSSRVGPDAMHASLARLTPRQQTILRLLGQGKASADIGAKLGLSENTISPPADPQGTRAVVGVGALEARVAGAPGRERGGRRPDRAPEALGCDSAARGSARSRSCGSGWAERGIDLRP